MDDGLVLNISTDAPSSSGKVTPKKGGRWTDRVKAKRVAKRKNKSIDDRPAPAKKPRIDPPTQIISSLFSSNPKIPISSPDSPTKSTSKPSNAPLTDNASAFSALGLHPLLIAHLSNKIGVHKPTSIQRAALPVALSQDDEIASRDLFIQSQTGSGKTLSFLLPIIQDLLPLSTLSYIDRSIGTLAIIIAPTRELAKQISDVLDSLLKLRLRTDDDTPDDPSNSTRLTRWLVSGLLTGGATRTHEKARLRKGLPILVSTPGRLLDHLQNTASFNVGKCRWLILDEADRLMELGFEETITGIIKGLDGRRNLAVQAVKEGSTAEVGGWDWERRRRTILCSATIREDVQKLAGTTLVRPLMIKGNDSEIPAVATGVVPPTGPDNFTPPTQLSQKYVVVPLKLRLVALVALLRSLLSQANSRRGTKIIVFFSCTDSVDFHWRLLGDSTMDEEDREDGGDDDGSDDDIYSESTSKVEAKSSLLPETSIFRLHGSLATPTRLASLKGFSALPNPTNKTSISPSSILLCTSVASRGLDLPLVRAVIQYDLPTEGGATEYVHRVGRTARAGKGGEAWSIVAPSELEWVKWVEGKMEGEVKEEEVKEKRNVKLISTSIESVLRRGFGGKESEYEGRATDVQLSFERWVLRRKENADVARRAFLSHMRAYATHPSNEKHIFHIRHLHMGHLAKSFALREAPKTVTGGRNSTGTSKKTNPSKLHAKKAVKGGRSEKESQRRKDWDEAHDPDAERRMQKIVRAQGRLTKKGGVMTSSGVSEFQIAGGVALEKLVGLRK